MATKPGQTVVEEVGDFEEAPDVWSAAVRSALQRPVNELLPLEIRMFKIVLRSALCRRYTIAELRW